MVALAFLKNNTLLNGEAEVDLPVVIDVLRDVERQYMHDDAYDALDLLNPQYREDLPLLVRTLQDANAGFARWFALHAISKIDGHTRDFALLASSVLLDKDQYLRISAIDGIKKCSPQDGIVAVPFLVEAIKDQHTKVAVKVDAMSALTRILGLRLAVKELRLSR